MSGQDWAIALGVYAAIVGTVAIVIGVASEVAERKRNRRLVREVNTPPDPAKAHD